MRIKQHICPACGGGFSGWKQPLEDRCPICQRNGTFPPGPEPEPSTAAKQARKTAVTPLTDTVTQQREITDTVTPRCCPTCGRSFPLSNVEKQARHRERKRQARLAAGLEHTKP